MKLVANRAAHADPPPTVQEPDAMAAFVSETEPAPAPRTDWRSWPRPSPRILRAGVVVLFSLAVLGLGGYAVWSKIAAPPAAPAETQARLVVSSNPPGAEVLVDDEPRGVTPLALAVPVGPHRLTIRTTDFSRDVSIDARANVELVQHVEIAAPVAPPEEPTPAVPEPAPRPAGPAVGTLLVSSPIDVQLFQGDALIGSSQTARLLLPAGRHTITAVNEALGFSRAMAVDVSAGGTTRLAIQIPNGTLSVNALPWADVYVDGRSLGQTPLGNISLPIGSHQLVFRHPQLGERRQSVVVGVGSPTRVGVDMRQ